MLSREELKSCFDGVPGFPAHSVDDFVFLFSLNGDEVGTLPAAGLAAGELLLAVQPYMGGVALLSS